MTKYTNEMNLHLAQIEKYFKEGVIHYVGKDDLQNSEGYFYIIASHKPNAFDVYKGLSDALELKNLCVVIASEDEQVFRCNCLSFPVKSIEEAQTFIKDLEQSKAYKGMKVFFNYGFRCEEFLEELNESDE